MIVTSALPPVLEEAPSHDEIEIDCGGYVFRDESILGTRLQIELTARCHADAQSAAIAARSEIDRLNAILNGGDPKSELSLLNRSHCLHASPELFEVISLAEQWRLESNGAFSGRLGRALDLWRSASSQAPDRAELARSARDAEIAEVTLDSSANTILRPYAVKFALDAIAKGWIVDRAFEIARAAPGVYGALVDIGGDIRCGGRAPNSCGWWIGVPDASIPADNAPLVAKVKLSERAIATSGRGPRDRTINGVRYGSTLSPRDGWPIAHAISATAVAATAAESDAIATALLSMPTLQAIEWADRNNLSALVQTRSNVHFSSARDAKSPRFAALTQPHKQVKTSSSWPKDWVAYMTFTAPPRQLVRDETFRSPYMAMWMTTPDNKPVRTLLLVGNHFDWQKDNYIWWSMNDANNEHLVATRSMSTSGSGVYKILWDGTDDKGDPVPGGIYVLHVETSRERGRHTHRSLTLDFSQAKEFAEEIPSNEEAGGLRLNFSRP